MLNYLKKIFSIFLIFNLTFVSSAQASATFVDSFDVSSISFPLNKSWEKHCEENSITYVHPLQLP